MAIFENVSPKKVIDDEMHILYPVNLNDDGAVAGANSVHNCDRGAMKMDAMCGTIWIDTSNNENEKLAGFIHNTDANSFKFRHPHFYPALFLYKKQEDGDPANVLDYDVWSYGHMLSEKSYKSPHFKKSSNGEYEQPEFAALMNMRHESVYCISEDNVIYDPLLSSYYIKPDEGSNDKITTYFMPSEFSWKYNKDKWKGLGVYNDGKERQTYLENNVNVMLKYLIDANNNIRENENHDIDCWACFDDNNMSDYWWYNNKQHSTTYELNQVSLFPLYLKKDTPDNKCNERGGVMNIGYYGIYADGNRDDCFRIKTTGFNSHRQRELPYNNKTKPYYDDFINYNVFSTINMGVFKDASQKSARTVSICNDAISLAFMDEAKYVKVFSNDSKWISVPYQSRMLKEKDEISVNNLIYESNIIIPEYGDGMYTDKYLSPFTLDHYIRQENLDMLEKRAKGNTEFKSRAQKLFISSKPIECGRSQEKGIYVLYNSANLINSIKWADGDDIELEFENTAGVLTEDIQKYDP